MKRFGIEFEEQRGRFYSKEIAQGFFVKKLEEIKRAKPRFITATGFANSGGDFFIYYHFEIDKKIYTMRTSLEGMSAESVCDLFPGASWIERELAELYRVEFSGEKKKPIFRIA